MSGTDIAAYALARKARKLSTGGISTLPDTFNLQSLRNLRSFRGRMRKGLTGTFDINFIMDSYGAGGSPPGNRFLTALSIELYTALGDAGLGWTGYGCPATGVTQVNGNARPAISPVTFSGTWVDNYNGSATSPDFSHRSSVTPGSRIMRSFPANTANIRLFWAATSDGSNAGTARYSLDGASTWTNFTLSGSNQGTLLINAPSADAFGMILEIVGTNSCRFQGDYHTSTATSGVRVNKLCGSGITAATAAGYASTANWRQARYLLGANDSMDIIGLGANDQGIGQSKAQFKTSLATLITASRTIVSANVRSTGRDVYLLMPPENNRTNNSINMTEYQDAGFELVSEFDVGYRNMQGLFGRDPAMYAATGPYPKMNVDLLHPEPSTGGCDYIEAVYNDLMFG